MTLFLWVKNGLFSIDFKIDKITYDPKNACHMSYSALQCKALQVTQNIVVKIAKKLIKTYPTAYNEHHFKLL